MILGGAATCKWSKRDGPEIYYINMDKSADRKINMEKHLSDVGFHYHRVRGLTPKEIYIPDDIEKVWRTAWCTLQTSWKPPSMKNVTADINSPYKQYSSFTTALCGRGKKKNTPKELGCTTSHLFAMREAVYNTKSKSRYAIIIEDDVQFPFDVDWEAVAKSGPPGFQILQLFNSNEYTMAETWNMYRKNTSNIWTERTAKRFSDFWSTCAYMIDRVAIKPVVDAVIFDVDGWTSFNVIAGITTPCVPRACCPNATDVFVRKPPCVYAPRGYQAGK
jgi:GR25 family glycosyltransferase involved in LPS biosynthesis